MPPGAGTRRPYNRPVPEREPDTQRRPDVIAAAVGLGAVLALMCWYAGWTSPGRQHAAPDAALVLLASAPWAAAWVVAAMGFGWALRRLLLPEARDAVSAQVGLGVAALLWLDSTLGTLGALQWGGSIGAWALLGAGCVLAAVGLARHRSRIVPLPPWCFWMSAPAVAVLLLAACSAPGWLWASEFGGYDALSYHLQLPKEWFEQGRIEPLRHNVYSFLPGFMEAAYYHLAALRGDPIEAAYACQLLHAMLSLLCALVTARLASRHAGRGAGAAAAVVLLGTPWVVVAGSLAYNEMTVALLLASAMAIAFERPLHRVRGAAALGVLAAAACGVKLTAAGFVALPVGVLLLAALERRAWPAAAASAALAGLVVLLPYIWRNTSAAGNPVFPFAAGFLGQGHWTAEQAAIWTRGHGSPGLGASVVESWRQLWRYGLGPSPYEHEPWAPQWSILPWLAVAGGAAACASARFRAEAARLGTVLALQLLFWMLLTHVRSRFMLPAVVPASILPVLGASAVAERLGPAAKRRPWPAAAALPALFWAALSAVVFAREPHTNARPGVATRPPDAPSDYVAAAGLLSGAGLSPDERHTASVILPAVMVNYGLPDGSRVLLVGEAAPLYYDGDRIAYQTTWDRGPLSRAMAAGRDPRLWFDRLRAEGFTHLLVNATMLRIWERAGWSDPALAAGTVVAGARLHADLVREYPGEVYLFGLREWRAGGARRTALRDRRTPS